MAHPERAHEHEAHEHEHEHGGLDDLHAEWDTTPVHEAAREGRARELREILAADGSQAAATDKYGLTALHWASDRGHAEAARTLLAAGADANAVERRLFKRRPLHFAALGGAEEVARALLKSEGLDVGAVDYRGAAALHGAAHAGATGVVRLLLDAGADARAATRDGLTALHVAAREGREQAALELLRRDPGLRGALDGEGRSAAQVAQAAGHAQLARLLLVE